MENSKRTYDALGGRKQVLTQYSQEPDDEDNAPQNPSGMPDNQPAPAPTAGKKSSKSTGRSSTEYEAGIVVGAAIFVLESEMDEDKVCILLCQRSSSSSSYPGLWEFPGGKLEPGETIRQCVKREVKEELGVECRVADNEVFSGVINGCTIQAYCVYPQSIKFKLTVHDAVMWINPLRKRNYSSLPLLPSTRPIIKAFLKTRNF